MTKIAQRDLSIDILRFFACLLITNSHMEMLYGPYEKLATGGAIGDVLFFFCSGFTIFLGRTDRFDNWYKKRINRIYPSVFAWEIIRSFFMNSLKSMKATILKGGGWFVSCIMIYYVILFFIRKYLIKRLWLAFGISCVIIFIWYFFEDRSAGYNMYDITYYKWGFNFLFVLFGAILGISKKREIIFSFKKDSALLIISVIIYYGLLFLRKYELFNQLQIISLIPLLSITYYFYKVCNAGWLINLYQSKYIGWVMRLISILTLEIYIVQYQLFTDKFNHLFPLNLIIVFIIIVMAAYVVKVFSRILSQIFKEAPMDWKPIFKI